jgi:NADH dehydrogenase/NADH:ubiquinone oxidoreductase subunit G
VIEMEKKMNLTIDGTPVSGRPGQTILEAAKEHDIYIPTLCYIEDLSPIGACRLCVVEVEGSRTLVGSCHTPIGEGMVIQTHSPKVLDAGRPPHNGGVDAGQSSRYLPDL